MVCYKQENYVMKFALTTNPTAIVHVTPLASEIAKAKEVARVSEGHPNAKTYASALSRIVRTSFSKRMRDQGADGVWFPVPN
jgi:hypothetical protein